MPNSILGVLVTGQAQDRDNVAVRCLLAISVIATLFKTGIAFDTWSKGYYACRLAYEKWRQIAWRGWEANLTNLFGRYNDCFKSIHKIETKKWATHASVTRDIQSLYHWIYFINLHWHSTVICIDIAESRPTLKE